MENNLNAMTVSGMVKVLSKAYLSLIEKKLPFRKFPSVMLWGPPGVGKSQGVREIAKTIEEQTDKKVVITDVRLLLFNPVDLRGIPTANEEKTLAVWLKPKIFQMDESEDVVNILFLDEISSAPQSVQAAAYQITLDRTVGEHRLPENCIIIAAGNRVTDKSVAYNMPKALANRLCHFEIKGDAIAWHSWAIKNALHPFVVGYLEYNSVALMRFDAAGSGLAFPTPRSWEMVSNILTAVSDDMQAVSPMISGCIGLEETSKFRTWTELYAALPSVEEIFKGRQEERKMAPELQTALRSAMVAYAIAHPTQEGINHSVTFACRLPWSFRRQLLLDYYHSPIVRPLVQENEIFKTMMRNGHA